MSVYQDRRNKFWGFSAPFVQPDGTVTTVRKSLGRGATKKDAEAAERAARAAVRDYRLGLRDAPAAPKPAAVPFSGFAKKFWDTWVAVKAKRSTQRVYEQIIRVHLAPYFGDRDVRGIVVRDVDEYVAAKVAAGLSHKSIANHVGLLGAILARAVKWEVIAKNPVSDADKVKVKQHERPFLDGPTADRFLAAVLRRDPAFYPFFYTALSTGMRLGELLGLTWSNVDLDREVIRVCRTLVRGHEETPKSGRNRTVPISSNLAALLRTLPRGPSALVFHRGDGAPLTRDMVKAPLWRARDAVGADPRLTIHDLRHSFASQVAMGGSPLTALREILGHADLKMTQRYSHLTDTARKAAVANVGFGPPVLVVLPGGDDIDHAAG